MFKKKLETQFFKEISFFIVIQKGIITETRQFSTNIDDRYVNCETFILRVSTGDKRNTFGIKSFWFKFS
jgi:hypothetical protein